MNLTDLQYSAKKGFGVTICKSHWAKQHIRIFPAVWCHEKSACFVMISATGECVKVNGVCVPASALEKFVNEWQAKEGEAAPLDGSGRTQRVALRILNDFLRFVVYPRLEISQVSRMTVFQHIHVLF